MMRGSELKATRYYSTCESKSLYRKKKGSIFLYVLQAKLTEKKRCSKRYRGRWPFALFAFGGSFLNCDSATDDPFCVQKQNKTVQQFQTSRPKQSSSERPGKAKRNDVAFRISLPWFGARSVAIYLAKTMRWEKLHRSTQQMVPVPSERIKKSR